MPRPIHPPRRRALARGAAATVAAALAFAAVPLATSAAIAASSTVTTIVNDEPGVPEFADSPDSLYGTTPDVEAHWGDEVAFVAPAGFWAHGAEGEWGTTNIHVTAVASTELAEFDGQFIDLSFVLSEDGTTLTATLPDEQPPALDGSGEPLSADLYSWEDARIDVDVVSADPSPTTERLTVMAFSSITDPSTEEPTDPEEPTASLSASSVGAGGSLTVTGSGFEPGEDIEIWLHSTPVRLFSGNASGSGAVSQTVAIPSGTAAGAHQVEIRGATSGSVFSNLTVLKTLAATGVDVTVGLIAAGVLLLAGVGLVLTRRRRARHGV